jgi:16S rRNA (cytidine1402-2'-O)-methyltransferase
MATLYIVATPIGNLQDMVPRALEILQQVKVIGAEDTRHSARLAAHFGIATPMLPYHDHSRDADEARLLAVLRNGGDVALISDAGTPLISDPGFRLVRAALAEGFRVSPVPGPSAVTAALSVAGLPTDRFSFEGFLPARVAARRSVLETLATEPRTMVFFEAPHRIVETLQDMNAAFSPERPATLVREISKTFETVRQDTLAALLDWVSTDDNQQRGEIVLVVQGAPQQEAVAITAEHERILKLLAAELPPKKAAALAAEITGADKKQLYQRLIARF